MCVAGAWQAPHQLMSYHQLRKHHFQVLRLTDSGLCVNFANAQLKVVALRMRSCVTNASSRFVCHAGAHVQTPSCAAAPTAPAPATCTRTDSPTPRQCGASARWCATASKAKAGLSKSLEAEQNDQLLHFKAPLVPTCSPGDLYIPTLQVYRMDGPADIRVRPSRCQHCFVAETCMAAC